MNLQEYLNAAVTSQRKKSFDRSDQLALGEIIAKCEAIADKGYRTYDGSEPRVYFDFGELRPTGLDSWRGSYAELALSYDEKSDAMPLSTFLDVLRGAVGATYEGYKGGEFTMSRHTPVWVANYGYGSHTAVIDVVDDDYIILLITGYREY